MKKNEIYRILTVFAAILALTFALSLTGCGGKDKGKSDEIQEDATLPEDTGDNTLLDTTTSMAEQGQPKAEQPKEEPKTESKPKPKPKPKPKEPEIVKETILPANSILKVEMLNKISTGENQVGDKFRASLLGSGEEGVTLNLPSGTILEGVVADINDGKAEGEKAFIKLKFTSLMMPGEKPLPMEGYILTDAGDGYLRPGGQGTSIAKDAGVGAVAGAVLGGILGKKGEKNETAVKTGAAGAVVGGIAGAILHKDQVTLKEGAKFDIGVPDAVIKETVKN